MAESKSTRARYEARVKAVEDYIHEHLEDAIDLGRLADIACLSPYHWHRVYHSLQGETVHATLSRLRLQQAAWLLVNTDLSLKQVSRKSGYSAAPPFSRAFKSAYGVSPIKYRSSGPHALYQPVGSSVANQSLNVVVREQPQFDCVAIPHSGRYMDVDRAFSELFRKLAAADISNEGVLSIGVYFDDPAAVSEPQLESLACAAGIPEADQPAGLDRWIVPGGLHAILRHQGPYDALDSAYSWLFGHWLPESGYEPADEPVYEIYINNPRDTAPMNLLVDICLPLISA